jgi:hypothetical protein
MLIPPTVGRVVLFFQWNDEQQSHEGPHAATIAKVHTDRCVNVGFLEFDGTANRACNVPLVQSGDPIPEEANYCRWMDYQLGQAAKAEAAEKKLQESGV